MFPAWLLSLLIPYLWPHYHPEAVCRDWYANASIRTLFWLPWVHRVALTPFRMVGRQRPKNQLMHHPAMHPDLKEIIRRRQHECFKTLNVRDCWPILDRLWSFEQAVEYIDDLVRAGGRLVVIRGIEATHGFEHRRVLYMELHDMSLASVKRWRSMGMGACQFGITP